MKKLFLLTRTPKYGPIYDCNDGVVIRAEDEAQARQLANEHLRGDEGKIWEDPKQTTCAELHQDGCVGIIMVDFHAG
jgi:hypothetical protein